MNQAPQRLKLEWLPPHVRYAVCRLDADAEVPHWALRGDSKSLLSITRTDRELSIVIDETLVPDGDGGVRCERAFAAMRVVGTLDFGLVGILATLTGALAAAKIPVLAISTFDTDIILVREDQAPSARETLATIADFPAYCGL